MQQRQGRWQCRDRCRATVTLFGHQRGSDQRWQVASGDAPDCGSGRIEGPGSGGESGRCLRGRLIRGTATMRRRRRYCAPPPAEPDAANGGAAPGPPVAPGGGPFGASGGGFPGMPLGLGLGPAFVPLFAPVVVPFAPFAPFDPSLEALLVPRIPRPPEPRPPPRPCRGLSPAVGALAATGFAGGLVMNFQLSLMAPLSGPSSTAARCVNTLLSTGWLACAKQSDVALLMAAVRIRSVGVRIGVARVCSQPWGVAAILAARAGGFVTTFLRSVTVHRPFSRRRRTCRADSARLAVRFRGVP